MLRSRHTCHITHRHTHGTACNHTWGGQLYHPLSWPSDALTQSPICCGTVLPIHKEAGSLAHPHNSKRVCGHACPCTRGYTHNKVTHAALLHGQAWPGTPPTVAPLVAGRVMRWAELRTCPEPQVCRVSPTRRCTHTHTHTHTQHPHPCSVSHQHPVHSPPLRHTLTIQLHAGRHTHPATLRSCTAKNCGIIQHNAPEFLSSQCSMTVSPQCSTILVITMFHDHVITMLHGPCHHNASEYLSLQCSMTVFSQCSMALVITMLQNSCHHNVR